MVYQAHMDVCMCQSDDIKEVMETTHQCFQNGIQQVRCVCACGGGMARTNLEVFK
jgi:hypothetical protein